ncbi:MAG: TIGR03750 family conjugal transfer protein [Pseudoxanthomonas sp.]|jgi:conjugative transfer region protein (TIGR03750 family)|nr:TIGR03750 family conjugal transfer protein [Pseudoxanthomonas sp.]HRL52871.1 TIGR03750 family conjugal transfer protein [Acidovorax temperans]
MSRSRAQANADAEAARQRAPITDRVNVEPPILNGMTVSEAQVIALTALAVFLLIGGLLFSVTRYWQFLLLLGIFGPAVTLWFASLYLARIKRGRPDAYYKQRIHFWLAERGLVKHRYITHDGWWSLGRTLEFPISSAFEPPTEAFDSPTAASHRKPS